MLHCESEKEGLDSFYKLLDEFINRDKSLDKEDKIPTQIQRAVESRNRLIMKSSNEIAQPKSTEEKNEEETSINL